MSEIVAGKLCSIVPFKLLARPLQVKPQPLAYIRYLGIFTCLTSQGYIIVFNSIWNGTEIDHFTVIIAGRSWEWTQMMSNYMIFQAGLKYPILSLPKSHLTMKLFRTFVVDSFVTVIVFAYVHAETHTVVLNNRYAICWYWYLSASYSPQSLDVLLEQWISLFYLATSSLIIDTSIACSDGIRWHYSLRRRQPYCERLSWSLLRTLDPFPSFKVYILK